MIRKELNWGDVASLFVVVAISLIAACKPADPETTNVLERGNGGHPGSLDPLLAEDVHAFRILADLYEGLVVVGPDGQLQPGVAKRWQISDDGLVWRFELRSDARWSDGKAVTADDFVRTFRRLASGETESSYEFLLYPIVNFEAVNGGQKELASLGVEAINERTLEFRLSTPTPHWLSILSTTVAMPTRKADAPVFNGAYTLFEETVNERVRLIRNPNYWDSDNVAIEEVVYHSIVNPNTEYSLYNTGGLRITATVPVDVMQTLPDRHGSELRIAPTLGLYYIAFDLSEPPFDNIEIRKALTMAMDRSALVKLLGRGEQPALGVVPDGIPDYVAARYDWADDPLVERLAAAQASLVNAGINQDKPLSLTLVYDAGDIHERVALIVADMWQRLANVNVTLDKREWQHFLATRDQRQDWDTMRFAWLGDYDDATTFLDIFVAESDMNLPGFQNERYDALISGATYQTGPERASTLSQAETLLINDYPVAPVYFFSSKHLVHPSVKGFQSNTLDRHLTRFLRIEE